MNFYEHHLGDYAKDTAHLTMLEHGAYRLLLDRYYGTEQGIAADQTYRIARARTRDEKQAVDVVLAEFFELADGVWRNKRADAEIGKAHVKINAARENGKRGGRPKGNPNGSEGGTENKPSGFSAGSNSETQDKAHQTPDTRHQTPDSSKPNTSHTDSTVGDAAAGGSVCDSQVISLPGTACLAMRREGIADTNPSHPILLALIEAGATPDEFAEAARTAKRKDKLRFDYVVGIVRKQREDAAALLLHQGPLPASPPHAGSQAAKAFGVAGSIGLAPKAPATVGNVIDGECHAEPTRALG